MKHGDYKNVQAQLYRHTWAVRADQTQLKNKDWKTATTAIVEQMDETCGTIGYNIHWAFADRIDVSAFRSTAEMFKNATWRYRLVVETERTIQLAQAISEIAAAQAMVDRAVSWMSSR